MKRMQINLRTTIDEKEIVLKAVSRMTAETGKKGTVSSTIKYALKKYVNQEPEFEKCNN